MKKNIFIKLMFAAIVMLFANINVRGDEVTYVFSANYGDAIEVTSGTIVSGSISFTAQKNSAGTSPTVYTSGSTASIGLRLYGHSSGNGNSITFIPQNGAVITGIELTATSASYHPKTTYFIDDDGEGELTWFGLIGTLSGIEASTGLTIQNTVAGTTQLRFNTIKITYTPPSCSDAGLQFDVTRISKFEGDPNFTKVATSVNGSTGAITYTSSNTGVATVDNNGEVTITGAGTAAITASIAAAGTFCAAQASYTLKVYPGGVNAKTYSLVHNVSDLTDNAQYLIIGKKGSEYYALGWQKPNNRHAIEIPVENSEVRIGVATTVIANDEIYPYAITLKKSGSDWILFDEVNNENLTPATGDNNNHLKLTTEQVKWGITFSGDAAIINAKDNSTYKRNRLRFNDADVLFSCYKDGQEAVFLYKETVATPFSDVILTFNPANGATNVSVNTAVTITSPEPLRELGGSELTNSIDWTNIITFVGTSGTVAYTATVSDDKKVITITPSSALDHSETYLFIIENIADAEGKEIAAQDITFTTENETPASTNIRYVKQGGAGNKDGLSWANASDDLQKMINESQPTNQVWVAAG
ncbi:MAG: Ig-like domain-containing protein, partial [Prevotellaceae bacterium]|nr:Ig-like domain-containing protein [Prevotellaceae bacterium]